MPTITTSEQLSRLLLLVRKSKVAVVDTETTGLEPWTGDHIVGIGLCLDSSRTFYLPYRHVQWPEPIEGEDPEPPQNLPIDTLPDVLKAIGEVDTLVGHNLKFDIAMMSQDGYVVPTTQKLLDTMSAARLCEPDRYASLDQTSLLEKHLGGNAAAYDAEFIAEMKTLKLSKKRKGDMAKAPIPLVGGYCESDVLGCTQLLEVFTQIIDKTQQTSLWKQEIKTTRTLWEMERVGMGFDQEFGAEIVPVLERKVELLKGEVNDIAGTALNVDSPPQLRKVMENLGLKSFKKGTSGPSWDKEVLEALAPGHPMPAKILELRSVQKVLRTDIRPRLQIGTPTIHAPIKSYGAVTGRMSSGWHTLPREGIMVDGRLVAPRDLIVPREGFKLYLADYSQMEMRVFADYMGDPDLLTLIEGGGLDYHALVAKEVWQVDESHPDWKEFRRMAKAINFGLIYGIGIKKLALQLGVSQDEARSYKQEYFNRMPRAEAFIDGVHRIAEGRGYVRNRFNRRYWIDQQRVYVAVNYLVQGTSADLMKNRMIAIQRYIEENALLSRILLQVHDELIFEVHHTEEQWFPKKIKDILEHRLITAHLAVDVSIGDPGWGTKIPLEWCDMKGLMHPTKEHEEVCVAS